MLETFCHTDDVVGAVRILRNDLGTSDTSPSVLQDVAELSQLSLKWVAKAMFGRAVFAFKWKRRYIHLGVDLCVELVNALALEEPAAQDRILTQFGGEWPFPITRNGRLRNCATPGCAEFKRRAVMIVRRISRLARRLLDVNNPDLAWLLRARHGAENSRKPRCVRQSAKTTARRVVRGSPACEASRDCWPGKKALSSPESVCTTAGPQPEPADLLSGKVVALNTDLVPHASKGDSGQPVAAAVRRSANPWSRRRPGAAGAGVSAVRQRWRQRWNQSRSERSSSRWGVAGTIRSIRPCGVPCSSCLCRLNVRLVQRTAFGFVNVRMRCVPTGQPRLVRGPPAWLWRPRSR